MPLLPEGEAPRPAGRLNPVSDIGRERSVMVTQYAAAVPARDLGERVLSLAERADEIDNALDMLIVGF